MQSTLNRWLPPTRRRQVAIMFAVGGGALALQKALKPAARPKPSSSSPKKPRKKVNSKLLWAEIWRLIDFKNDIQGKRRLAGIVACAIVFVLVDLRKARLQGELFRELFLGQTKNFMKLLLQNVFVELTLTCFNKLLANIVSSLGQNWHSRMVKSVHDQYFSDLSYYRLKGSSHDRIAGDIPLFTRQLSLVACDMINATLNFGFYASQILRYGGRVQGMGGLLVAAPVAYMLFGFVVMSRISPNFAKMQREQRALDGQYRAVQSRLQANAESVALFGGEQYERDELDGVFKKLCEHNTKQSKSAWWFEVIKQFISKYCSTTMMMTIILAPFFRKGSRTSGSAKESANILFEMRYLGDLILHEMFALGQVARLLQTLQGLGGLVDRIGNFSLEMKKISSLRQEQNQGGMIKEGNVISFDDVTIVTPTGTQLCEGLTFDVKENDHLIVCGPNGAGKSSIFRCLGTLWPIPKGTITRPGGNNEGLISDVYYLPQKPYNVLGSLIEQITYPNSPEAEEEELTTDKLRMLLRMVELEYLMDMKADDSFNWEDKISLGETQRLAMARLFWHKPKYAILDECTSAVSLKMEERLFITCRRMGITLITISHRPALQNYHNRMLILDGSGGWSLEDIPQSTNSDNGEFDVICVGDRGKSLSVIMSELESKGQLTAHTKEGASLEATDKLQFKKGLWSKLFHLNSLMFASRSEQFISLGSLAALVVVRTWISNAMAQLSGRSLTLMLNQDIDGFVKLTGMALLQGFAQSLMMPTLEHLEKRMSLHWRKRLTTHIMEKYFKHQAYYKLKETMPDLKEIGQIDQVLAHDIEKLTEGVANLWHDLVKPIVDVLWFARGMYMLVGMQGLKWQYFYIVGGTMFLRLVRPNLAQLSAVSEKLAGQFRFVHSRLRTHSESVAFFNGAEAERRIIEKHFDAKLEHQTIRKRKEHIYGVAQQFVGYFLPQNVVWVMSMVYQRKYTAEKAAEGITELSLEQQGEMGHNLRYLGSVVNHSFSAFGSIMELYGKTELLIGHVYRVSKLLEALDKVEQLQTGVVKLEEKGTITFTPGSDVITYDDAVIMTPNFSQTIGNKISFSLDRNKDVGMLLTGPNGSGKSSILRILASLWPLKEGSVSAPSPNIDIFFCPTTPYMPRGTLIDQITYPERLSKPVSEEQHKELCRIMNIVRLGYLIEREEGFDRYSENFDAVFSLGEQQRLNVARIFWNKPRFVCLDECTSAVALDGEEEIYKALAKMKCTVLTASQKPWLTNFHSCKLDLKADGKGSWEFSQIDESMKFKGLTRLSASAYVDNRQK